MKNYFFLFLLCLGGYCTASAQETIIQYLSGTDKDHTVQWDFFCTGGMNSGKWEKIAVPSNWELQGFGAYNYGHDKVKADEEGLYKHAFKVPALKKGKRVFIVFEGSMTDTEVKINGHLAGAVHQGSFYQFKYDITSLIKPGESNLLEVRVSKMSANASVNKAERNGDYWVFGGIYRPVYLEIVPETFIERVAIDAKADGAFNMDVYHAHAHEGQVIEAQIQKLSGEHVGKLFSKKVKGDKEKTSLHIKIDHPLQWSPEFPNLYRVLVTIKDTKNVIHQVKQSFGFRTVEVKPKEGIYINGAKVMFKGADRHSFWPESGRALSRDVHLMDIRLMKEMNMNAVRMSHYPPDQQFLYLCDSLGLFVLDELNGWQKSYDTATAKRLVKEMVVRDVNHPSVVVWDNGNEGGWNTAIDDDFKLYDPQKRIVIHPWQQFGSTDTKHYPDYQYIQASAEKGEEIFFPTEFLHGLYDGGLGAGLDDYWNLMLRHPRSAGGFLWALLDEGVVRTDKNGVYDTDGNHAPDGILGPHREKEASFYTIKEIWSPVYIAPRLNKPGFNDKLDIENRYMFTNLNQCRIEWKLLSFPSPKDATTLSKVIAEGQATISSLKPGKKGVLDLHLPAAKNKADALYLTAYDPNYREIFTWSWLLRTPQQTADRLLRPAVNASAVKTKDADSSLVVSSDHINYYFNKRTGLLQRVIKGNTVISLSGGPVLAGVDCRLDELTHRDSANSHIIACTYSGDASLHVRWTFHPGQPVKLEYTYVQTGEVNFSGITFNYPEEKITGMKWLGRGPYRVWKNRMKGMQMGVWHKAYNNAVTGETWDYPEFKGYHAAWSWAVIENKEAPFTVFTENENTFLQMGKPKRPKDAPLNNNVVPEFPNGELGFLQTISPIGTKFKPANEKMGPQSEKNKLSADPVHGVLWFDFR